MLKHLHIQNYALIGNLDIDFPSGFSIITGETGAGKSIILGALALVMGGKADAKVITDGEDHCVIEAIFGDESTSSLSISDKIIRRELYSSGRSRSLVNDEIVKLSDLKMLASQLIDIHSQHENLLLGDGSFQIAVVDAIAGNQKQLSVYQECYSIYVETKQKLTDLVHSASEAKDKLDYIEFQYNQLEDAHLQVDEMELLEQEEYKLSHAEEIQSKLQNAIYCLDGDELGAIRNIHNAQGVSIGDLDERLQTVEIELRDIADEMQHICSDIESNPDRLQEVQERISDLSTLLHKHHVSSIKELLDLKNTFGEQLQQMYSYDEDIAILRKDVEMCFLKMQKAADDLTQSRKMVASDIAKQLMNDLFKLGIIHANISVEIDTANEYTLLGHDDVQFMFAANLNQSLRRVSEVASGGEISRLMLCIKSLIASISGLPTIIFDEIDTGVSGEIASQMGQIMHNISNSRQILAITHLPQIAAIGDAQYKVYKLDTAVRTETHIKLLSKEERVHEIATMLSTNNPSQAAIDNAKQLLNQV